MMQRVSLVIFLLMIGTTVFAADDVKNVLVVHSYHQGWEWTDHITEGIQSVLKPFSDRIALHFEYLDSRSNNSDDYLKHLSDLYRLKFKNSRFDVIIVSDDEALRFVRRYRAQPFFDIPVVFCGLSRIQSMASAQGPETGVVAHLDHQSTLNLMLKLHPDCDRVLVFRDAYFLNEAAQKELEKALFSVRHQVAVEFVRISDLTRLPAELVGLGPNDLIYLLIFDHDQSPNQIAADQAMALVRRWSPVAVYSPLDFCLGKGIVGGMITSGVSQGEQAARLALRILSGQRAQDIPVLLQSPNRYMFDGSVLRHFHISTAQLPAASAIINPQPAFWMRHGIIILGLLTGLLVSSGLLLLLLLRQRGKQHTLVQTNVELDGRVREKSAHLQLVSQKLKKQTLIDSVTGIPNRRHVYQRFVEEVKKAQRYFQPLAVLVLNVDGFKQIHDQHDYLVAERVLRDVGQAVRRSIREIDLVGRYGAEAFIVVLPNTDQGRCAAERIRQSAVALKWEQGKVTVTLSGGLAQLQRHTPAELVALAEKRLDIAKSQGGNRIIVAEADGDDEMA